MCFRPSLHSVHVMINKQQSLDFLIGMCSASAGIIPSGPGQTPVPSLGAAMNLASLLQEALASAGAPQHPHAHHHPAQHTGAAAPQAGGSQQEHLAAALIAALGQQRGGRHAQEPSGPSLREVLKPSALTSVLSDPAALSSLAPYLPGEHRTDPGALRDLLHR